MALKVKDIVIQAKFPEEQQTEASGQQGQEGSSAVPQSVKQEIVDLCLEKMKEFLERNTPHARR